MTCLLLAHGCGYHTVMVVVNGLGDWFLKLTYLGIVFLLFLEHNFNSKLLYTSIHIVLPVAFLSVYYCKLTRLISRHIFIIVAIKQIIPLILMNHNHIPGFEPH